MLPTYRFGKYELDLSRRELRCDDAAVQIQPRPLELLSYLARHHERVVPRSELLGELWRDVHVSDEALGFAVHQARRAVGDDGTSQSVIRTVSRSGFRFVATLAVIPHGQARATAVFVGRSETLDEIGAALRDATRGCRTLLLLGGEAGIGKSRTAEMAAIAARDEGFRVFASRCVEADGAPVFWPWIQLLRGMLAELSADDLATALGPGARELAQLVPELRERLPSLGAREDVDPKVAHFFLLDSVAELVRHFASAESVLLAVDDLHRADRSSLMLLRDLVGQLAGTRVVLLGTHRSSELVQDSFRADLIADLVAQEGARPLTLGGLSEEEVEQLVGATTGRLPSPAVRSDLLTRTNGNPFFLHQILNVLRSENRLEEVELARPLGVELPRHAHDAIARQVAGLPPELVSLLEVAAVIGRDFPSRALELAAEARWDELLPLLRLAVDAGIIVDCDGESRRYRFVHVLLRDALYRRMSPAERSLRHRAVGEALLRLGELEGAPADLPTLSHHFFEAAPMGDVVRALEFAVASGRWSEDHFAFEEAVSSFARALELCQRQEAIDSRMRSEMLLLLGDAQTKAGRREEARESFKIVARLAKSNELPEDLAAAALRFAPDFLSIETGVHDPELVELLEEALANLPVTDSLVRARLLGRLAVALHWAPGSMDRRRDLCCEANAIAERSGDPAAIRYVRCAEKLALYSIENCDRYLGADSSSLPEGKDAPIVLLEQLLRMTSLLQLARVDEFSRGIDVFTTLVDHLRQPQAVWYRDLFRATIANLAGRFADADAHARSYRELGERFQDRNVLQSLQIPPFLVAIDRGGLERFEAPLLGMVSRFPELLGWRSGLALLYSELGQRVEAHNEIDLILDLGLRTHPKRNDWMATVLGTGLAAAESGHLRGAAESYRLAECHAGELLVIGYSSFCWGAVALPLGVIAMAHGEWKQAEKHMAEAEAINRGIGAFPALARTHYYQARMRIAMGSVEVADALLEKASALAVKLGLERLDGKVRRLRTR